MWDIGADGFDSFQGIGILDVATISLDGPTIEAVVFGEEEVDEAIGLASTSS